MKNRLSAWCPYMYCEFRLPVHHFHSSSMPFLCVFFLHFQSVEWFYQRKDILTFIRSFSVSCYDIKLHDSFLSNCCPWSKKTTAKKSNIPYWIPSLRKLFSRYVNYWMFPIFSKKKLCPKNSTLRNCVRIIIHAIWVSKEISEKTLSNISHSH